MKKLIVIFLVLGLVSCKTNKINNENISFLNEFRTIKLDTLKYIDVDYFAKENIVKKLKSEYNNLYPTNYLLSQSIETPIEAIVKFKLDKNNWGLIIKGRGEKKINTCNFLLYNKKLKKITSFLEILNSTKTDEYYFLKKGTIFKPDSNNIIGTYSYESIFLDDKNNIYKDFYIIKLLPTEINIVKLSGKELKNYQRFFENK